MHRFAVYSNKIIWLLITLNGVRDMTLKLEYEQNRIFALNEHGQTIAEVTFPAVSPDCVNINHTYVSPSLRGQGVADSLMHAAVETISLQNKKAIATCPYADQWLDRHPEQAQLVKD